MDLSTPLPKTWEEFISLQTKLREAGREFLRSPIDNHDYSSYREVIPKDLQVALIKKQIGDTDHAFLKNRYPYSRLLMHLPTVSHWCLWSTAGKLSEEKITELVEERFPDRRWVAIESTYKSLPEIWHTHVFVEGLYEE